jgi:muramoyltetrapeptide carboxypeptidase
LKQKNDFRYFSAPDKERATELNSYFERDDINAIICGRGGYGMMRILPELKFDKLLIHPKIIMGFSDITALINSIYKKTGLVTFHGPVASYSFKDSVALNLNNLLFTKQSFSPINLVQPNVLLVNPGVAQGKLVGGNLTILSSLLGTEYEIETENSILFLEDVAENAYDIDRMLTQLLLANKIQKANAIIFGTFPNLNTKRPFFPNRGYSILEVINQLIKPLNKPTMIGLPFCHNNLSWTLPIGVKAEVDTNKGKITLLEQAVYY